MSPSEEQFGEDRLMQFLESQPDRPSGDFADALLHELSIWSGRPAEQERDDDLTLVVAHFQSVTSGER